jgi:hypothetical protein
LAWRLFFVLTLSVKVSRIGEQFFEFLGRLGRPSFYLPLLSIKVVAKSPGVVPGALDLSFLGISALVLERLGANSFKALAQLTEVFYRRFLAILHGVIFAKYDVFIDFYIF